MIKKKHAVSEMLHDMLGETISVINSAKKQLDDAENAKMLGRYATLIKTLANTRRFYYCEDAKLWAFERQCIELQGKQLADDELLQLGKLENKFAILDDLLCQIYTVAMMNGNSHIRQNDVRRPGKRLNSALIFDILMDKVPVPNNWNWNSDEGQHLQNFRAINSDILTTDESPITTPEILIANLSKDSLYAINEIEKLIMSIEYAKNYSLEMTNISVVKQFYTSKKQERRYIKSRLDNISIKYYFQIAHKESNKLSKIKYDFDISNALLEFII